MVHSYIFSGCILGSDEGRRDVGGSAELTQCAITIVGIDRGGGLETMSRPEKLGV